MFLNITSVQCSPPHVSSDRIVTRKSKIFLRYYDFLGRFKETSSWRFGKHNTQGRSIL